MLLKILDFLKIRSDIHEIFLHEIWFKHTMREQNDVRHMDFILSFFAKWK